MEIPALVARLQAAHPDVPLVYAWPYETTEVASFLAAHLRTAAAP